MTAKSVWAVSSNGPDWTDVEMLMRAISGLHSGTVGLIVLPRGIGASGGLSTEACMTFDVLPGSSIPSEVTVRGDWPCNTHRELAAHMFALLHDLDHEISKVYQNKALWN